MEERQGDGDGDRDREKGGREEIISSKNKQ